MKNWRILVEILSEQESVVTWFDVNCVRCVSMRRSVNTSDLNWILVQSLDLLAFLEDHWDWLDSYDPKRTLISIWEVFFFFFLPPSTCDPSHPDSAICESFSSSLQLWCWCTSLHPWIKYLTGHSSSSLQVSTLICILLLCSGMSLI